MGTWKLELAVTGLAVWVGLAGETRLFDGVEPRPSADGTKILHRVETPAGSRVAVWEKGTRTWLDVRPGSSAYADWTPSGCVVYTYGHETETALAATRQGLATGFNLWIWDGRLSHQLTFGRQRDYAASVSPDGRTLYYTSTANALAFAGSNDPFANEASLFSLTLAPASPPCAARPVEILTMSIPSSGAVGPRPSPDGRILVWAQVDGFASTWRLVAARAGSLARICYLTPETMAATAPAWSPDGAYLAFTGFAVGDPGWGVYLQHIASGAMRRLCTGANPAFAADGKSLYYDRDGGVWQRPLEKGDRPTADAAAMQSPGEGASDAICVRAEVDFQPTNGFSYVMTYFRKLPGRGEQRALQLFFRDGCIPEFATRRADGTYAGVSWRRPLNAGASVVLTGIRLGNALYLSVDGQPPRKACFPDGLMEPLLPRDADCALGLDFPGRIRSCHVMKGWPKDVPCTAPISRSELVGGAQ